MMKDTKEKQAKATLCGLVLRFGAGMTRAQAETVVDQIHVGWGIPYAKLVKLAPVVNPELMTPGAALFWMHSMLHAMAAPNGRELVFAAGLRVARACGVAAELLDKLREHVVPPSPTSEETRH